MNKRLLVGLTTILLASTLCGCWNYRSLDQVDIVVGIAVDFDKRTNRYKLSYEIADLLSTQKKGSINGKIVESEGKTLFDAVRNAKRKEADKLFFGSAQIIIISQELAREMGIMKVIEWFLRDAECRETMCVALSQEDTAEKILENNNKTIGIKSQNIYDTISEDKRVTSSSIDTRLYQVYNMLESSRKSLMLPVLHNVGSKSQEVYELNGIAVFKRDKLAGFLTPEQSKYALFLENEIKGGLLTLSIDNMGKDNITLEIFTNKTKKSLVSKHGKVTVRIETDTEVAFGEGPIHTDTMDKEQVGKIENAAAQMIEDNIKKLVTELQTEFDVDAFGFGEMIYKHDYKLWKQLAPDWDQLYPTLEVEVISNVQVVNSASIR
jgi:spore germination protein KC